MITTITKDYPEEWKNVVQARIPLNEVQDLYEQLSQKINNRPAAPGVADRYYSGLDKMHVYVDATTREPAFYYYYGIMSSPIFFWVCD